ncbi:MAG: HEAT repeat domain-containing protein [Leptolyngbyaceae cyanobacterium CSU_1_4]|nr:HEAT repeat domain-containing protein [Leptolyngbyaceae cyanobacterium CSU_1_4]
MFKNIIFQRYISATLGIIYTAYSVVALSTSLFTARAYARSPIDSEACSDAAIADHIRRLMDESIDTSNSLVACGNLAVEPLLKVLGDDDEQLRSLAAYTLGQMGSKANRAIVQLLLRLGDRSASVRGSAAYALGQIAPDDARVVRFLIRRLALEVDPTVRDVAIEALRQATSETIPTLLEIFASQKDQEAELSAQVLLNFGEAVDPYLTPEYLPKILAGMSHIPWWNGGLLSNHRANFADYTLRKLGNEMIAHLITGLNGPNQNVQVGALRALSLGYSQRYFDRQTLQPAVPKVMQIFRNSQLYTLWQSENQSLMMTANQETMTADQNDFNDIVAAQDQVGTIIFGDRAGLSALELLLWIDESFSETLRDESQVAFELVVEIAFTVAAAGGIELASAIRSYQVSRKPAICRLPIARFIGRCR